MGVQVMAAPSDLGGPQSPLQQPTQVSLRDRMNGNKKLDVSRVSETESAPDKKSAPMKGFSRFLPLPHVLDLRSLALFRILFGLCQLGDIYGRLCTGKYDLAWYTSEPEDRSYYYPGMPTQDFQGFLGKTFLFQRGTIQQEIIFFVVYGILLTLFTIGFQCQNYWLMPCIWLFTNGMISKGDAGSWGSDHLAQQLVIWMLFLPLSEEWSVDAWIRRKRNIPSSYKNHQVKSVACLGLVLLLNMMYLGCTLERTYHAYAWDELYKSDWLWPDFPLVHYAANGSGTYNTWFTKIVRETAMLNQFMTFSGFLIECFMPPLCLLFNQRYSHWFAINLMALHLGIGLIIAIPHFAFMGFLIHTIWIPTHVWDRLLGGKAKENEAAEYKKTDGDERTANGNNVSNGTTAVDEKKQTLVTPNQSSIKKGVVFCVRSVSFLLQCLFFALLICTFLYENKWFLQYTTYPSQLAFYYFLMSNSWGMWSPGAERLSPYTVILGGRKQEGTEDEYDIINLFHFIKNGEEISFDDGFTEEFLADTTYLYPSTRWEKALGDDWEDYLQTPGYDISENILRAWCVFINEDMAKLGRAPIDAIEIRVYLRPIGTPESGKRYSDEDQAQEGSLSMHCFEDDDVEDDHDENQAYNQHGSAGPDEL